MYVISFTHVDHWGAYCLELMKSVQICMVVTITVGACVCHCCSCPPWFSSLFSLCFLEMCLLAIHRSHGFRTVLYGGYGCLVRLQNGYIFQLPQSARRWYISDHFCDCLVLQQENDVMGLQVYDELLKWGPSLRVYNGFLSAKQDCLHGIVGRVVLFQWLMGFGHVFHGLLKHKL